MCVCVRGRWQRQRLTSVNHLIVELAAHYSAGDEEDDDVHGVLTGDAIWSCCALGWRTSCMAPCSWSLVTGYCHVRTEARHLCHHSGRQEYCRARHATLMAVLLQPAPAPPARLSPASEKQRQHHQRSPASSSIPPQLSQQPSASPASCPASGQRIHGKRGWAALGSANEQSAGWTRPVPGHRR
jgi:hypothetical protein